jgi:DNA-binding XRE family transcriptional regulator
VRQKKPLTEKDLAATAKRFRIRAGKKRAQAAREMGVAQTSIFNAEETPGQSLTKLRVRMIEVYSPYEVVGAVYFLRRKPGKRTKSTKR